MKQSKFWSWLVILWIAIAVQFSFVVATEAAVVDWNQEQKFLTEVWQIVNRAYVDNSFNHQNWYKVRRKYASQKFQSRAETYAAIKEMLATLDDPFTRLLEPDQFKSMQTSTTGTLTGVGLQIAIEPETKSLVVIAPIEGSPAERAGVRSLDRIISIDNVPTTNLSLDECAERMRGKIGTKVVLSIERLDASSSALEKQPKSKIFDLTLQRDRIEVNPVISQLNEEDGHKVGYIRLNQFNGNAAKDMAQAIERLEAKDADRYVLDLRGNPGGLMQVGLEIARLWLPNGVIVYTVDRQGIQESFTANGSALTLDPLAVLMDGGTASASEILAGALQDNGRAKLVGTKSYGKGLIQSLNELEDGSGLAVTIAKYETPNHHDINKVGIQPDLEVPLSQSIGRNQLGTKDDNQYVAAVQLLAS